MGSKTSSLIHCCFLLIIILHSIPWGLAARILMDNPQNSTLNGNNQDDHSSSKGDVHGSHSGHAGSATGDISPSGTVQLSPPTEVTTITYEKSVNGGYQEYKKTVTRTEHHEYHSSNYAPPYQGNSNYFTPPAYQGNPFGTPPDPFSPLGTP